MFAFNYETLMQASFSNISANTLANSCANFSEPTIVIQGDIASPVITFSEFELVSKLEQLRPKVYSYCFAYLQHADDAEEACQDTIYSALRAIGKFAQRASLQTWVLKIAHNVCTASYRRNKLNQNKFEDFDETLHVSEAPLSDDENPELAQALMLLSSIQRDILRYRFVDELSLTEISIVLGLSLSATKMNYYRAISKLQKLYLQADI